MTSALSYRGNERLGADTLVAKTLPDAIICRSSLTLAPPEGGYSKRAVVGDILRAEV